MSKHKKIPKETRINLYNRYNHKCAYCGCDLEYKDMQIDHVKSVYVNMDYKSIMTEEEMYGEENFLPACRQCNFYKSTFTVGEFRDRLATVMMDNLRKDFNYRLAAKYGLVEEHVEPVKFYFETLDEREHKETALYSTKTNRSGCKLHGKERQCQLEMSIDITDAWISPDGRFYNGDAHDNRAEELLEAVYGEEDVICPGDRLEELGWIRVTTSLMWEVRADTWNGRRLPQKQYDALWDWCKCHGKGFPEVEVM